MGRLRNEMRGGMGEARLESTVWMRRPRSWWRLIVGWLCIAFGVLGIILPIIPGIPLLILGLVVLSTQYRWARECMLWMKKKFHRKPKTSNPPTLQGNAGRR